MSYTQIQLRLLRWYDEYKRELPWRNIADPYKIWISEIILQQTRVAQGYDYYVRFIGRFPYVETLAQAHEDEVLKYWQGLGYYSRARNLHTAAKQIMADFKGEFPNNYTEVLSLKGIGEYTAAAICSFAYKQPYAVVDGNVYRVLSRLFNIDTPIDSTLGKTEFQTLAIDFLNNEKPDIHNQAIMEFGALQCVPSAPNCSECCLRLSCLAYANNTVPILPKKQLKTKVRSRYFNYFFIENANYTYLVQRKKKDIWQHLFEFPLYESARKLTIEELFDTDTIRLIFPGGVNLQVTDVVSLKKHVLSHQHIYAQFIKIKIASSNFSIEGALKIKLDEIDKYAISRLTELFLDNHFWSQ